MRLSRAKSESEGGLVAEAKDNGVRLYRKVVCAGDAKRQSAEVLFQERSFKPKKFPVSGV